jgi:hypothetical protein
MGTAVSLTGETTVKSRLLATVVTVTAVLCLATAGQAAARPASSQVNGVQLQSGLLPASAFGGDDTIQASLNTGHKLKSVHVTTPVSRLTCDDFEQNYIVAGLGNTAGATQDVRNPDWVGQWPFTFIGLEQTVLQFPSSGAAASFFGQAHAKYAACTSYTSPNTGDVVPGGGSFDLNLVSLSSTHVAGHTAFGAVLTSAFSETPGETYYVDVQFALAGDDVYEIWQFSGASDQSPLMGQLIGRVQALYRR